MVLGHPNVREHFVEFYEARFNLIQEYEMYETTSVEEAGDGEENGDKDT